MSFKFGKVAGSKDHEAAFNSKKHEDDYPKVSKYILRHIQK